MVWYKPSTWFRGEPIELTRTEVAYKHPNRNIEKYENGFYVYESFGRVGLDKYGYLEEILFYIEE